MARIKIIVIFTWATAFLAACQSSSPSKPKPGASLEEQATFFVKSIVAYDFETSADYFIPEFVASMGGRDAMIKEFANNVAQFKADRNELSGGKADSPSAMSHCGGTQQCVLRQEVYMKMSAPDAEPFKMESNLVAISTDGGKNWKFLQTGNDDLATLRQQFPILCEDLVFQKY